jgi:hypothetical protein
VNDVVLGRGYPRTVGIWNARVVAKRVGVGDVRRARRRRRRNDNHRERCDRDATTSGLRCGGRVRDDDEEDANGGGAGGKRGRRGERDDRARGGVERTRKHDERKGGGGSGVGRGGGHRGG